MKKNVLVFPCGSEIGLEIYRSLSHSTHFELIGGSSVNDHGQFVYERYIDDVPFVDDPAFVDKINRLVEEHNIDYIIPAHDSAILELSKAVDSNNLACTLVTAPAATCEVARSKAKTYEFFKEILPTPKIYSQDELAAANFPVFLKPDVGQGSKGTQLANDKEEVSFYLRKDPTLLILENLPGKEYTVDCFTAKDGKLLFCEGRERSRISNGISVSSSRVNDSRFSEIGTKINNNLKFRGVWFFQVKESENSELVLMEIAPRVAGTMALARCEGVNLALLSLFDAAGYDVAVFENSYKLVIDRALGNAFKHDIDYTHVYLDFDDLVIFEDKVNPAVMAFVYQCINKDIKIHLLTRHKQDLDKNLAKYRLNDTFDEVIWVQDGSEKSNYIKEKDAIFIDDSFAERKNVSEKSKIPVFDSHMIESLMESF